MSGSAALLYNLSISEVDSNTWDITMTSQEGSQMALRMGGASITLRFNGTQEEAIGQAVQIMTHNGIGS